MMNIDITDMKSREIIKLLNLYPHGSLVTKFERIFWCSDYSEPENLGDNTSPLDPRGRVPHPNGPRAAQAFSRMADTLGSMVSPPPRR
jgi:hypothetical protein